MTESEYTPLALRTWGAPLRGTPDGIAYLQLGLLSEIGECYGVLKRILRDKTPLDVAQARFEDELGDVFWYRNVLLWEECQDGYDPDTEDSIACHGRDFLGDLFGMMMCAKNLGLDSSLEVQARARARNIAKLASRAERGVIQGSGGEQ